MSYRIHSREYMRRAREQLDKGTAQSLFYVAFELRCGVEARLQQYLGAQETVSEKRKRDWQVAKLKKNLDKVFRTGDKIVEFAFLDKKTEAVLDVFYYTPVNSQLKKMAQQLGDYLHAMQTYRQSDDSWWIKTRNFLEEVYSELEIANKGTVLGVPMLDRKTRTIEMTVEPAEKEEVKSLFKRIGNPGSVIKVRVTYLDESP